MAKTGPQKYAGASTSYWYGNRYPGSSMETNVIVWHSTEGTSLPSYGGGTSAPNLTAKPDFAKKKLVWYQHFDFDTSARALVNKAGGVETNTLNVCQVEVVGTCDPGTHAKWKRAGYAHLYMADLPDWAIRDLGAFAKWAHDKHGVPLSSGLTFKAYPGSYGNSGVRMSGATWNRFKGHCGHQHVPENDHGDPGAFPMAAILNAAKGGGPTPSLPKVSLKAVVYGATHAMADEKKHASYADDVARVQDALVAKSKLAKGSFIRGIFDVPTKNGYSAYQRSLGYSGADADGVPGMTSLAALGSGRFDTVA